MDNLNDLISISQKFGKNKDYIIAGGGNTSLKTDTLMFIKASGISLATITEKGFVDLDRNCLAKISDKSYDQDPVIRESQVKEDLMNCRINSGLRPSVESSLHNLINYPFVVHTHPTFINALLCSQNAGSRLYQLFNEEVLYIEYVDPGYILYKYVEEKLNIYQNEYKKHPRVIFLQNHGVFVGADNTREIENIYTDIDQKVKAHFQEMVPIKNLPAGDDAEKVRNIINNLPEFAGKQTDTFNNNLLQQFLKDEKTFKDIDGPFIPDHIVYCKAKPVYIRQGLSENEITGKINDYRKMHGYLPKIIHVQNSGSVLADDNEQSVQIIKDLVNDIIQISYYANNFGGPRFLSEKDIAFIENWEVENYRRKIMNK